MKAVAEMWKNRRCGPTWVYYAIAFGLGLALSCFTPPGLVLFVVAVLLVALGIALINKC